MHSKVLPLSQNSEWQKKLLFSQQLQLTTKPTYTNNEQYGFLSLKIITVIFVLHIRYNNSSG